jgi:hypothetical protein
MSERTIVAAVLPASALGLRYSFVPYPSYRYTDLTARVKQHHDGVADAELRVHGFEPSQWL